jgi:hypothetical protein
MAEDEVPAHGITGTQRRLEVNTLSGAPRRKGRHATGFGNSIESNSVGAAAGHCQANAVDCETVTQFEFGN